VLLSRPLVWKWVFRRRLRDHSHISIYAVISQMILILMIFLGATTVSVAQEDGDDDAQKGGGRIEALKIAYLTKQLNLSPEEAQKFWPIYNKYNDEVRKTRIDARQNKESEINTQEKLLNIRKKYNGEFVKALSTEKVNSFFQAEKNFGVFLQKELMERRMQRMENRKRLKNN
jgi:ABC-type Na+ efflux pump permease subunit